MEPENDNVIWINKQLSFIGQDVEKIPFVLCNFYGRQTRRLDLSLNKLKTLEGLEYFPNLDDLILDNNDINDYTEFPYCSSLQLLSLNKNKVKDLDKLLAKLVKAYPNLRFLSMLGNPACPDRLSSFENDDDDYQRYRYYVLFHLSKLNFLDSKMVSNSEKREGQRAGPYMKTVRPSAEAIYESQNADETDFRFTPLSDDDIYREPTHRGAYGRLRYKYTGKNSEGNRFIQNNQL